MNSEVKIHVTGQVQGVFFRSQIEQIAKRLSISGYAKNLSDGSVEVIAQGTKESLQQLIAEIKKSPGKSQVEDLRYDFHKPSKEYDGFHTS